ncbi:helix-turn-helix transcriptional regulator [Streptomyces sp. G45]|uniref:helix-turn-helix transcriptional regulator n=1 Tax=Streptomyces sp. G45 TaxID=3406627 RepID=UPI003C187D5A
MHRADATPAPCAITSGLLYADPDDTEWLRPTAPSVALPRLLAAVDRTVARYRRRENHLVSRFEPFTRLDRGFAASGCHGITVLKGFPRTRTAVEEACAHVTGDVRVMHPGTTATAADPAVSLAFGQRPVKQNARLRVLCRRPSPHGQRRSPDDWAALGEDVEVRALDNVARPLVIVGRDVAFMAAQGHDHISLEIRNGPLVTYLTTTFQLMWRLAAHQYPERVTRPFSQGVPARQRHIAALLVEGLNDSAIASRLQMNVRTARVHIAKLSTALGSRSRAELGYLIGRSGILEKTD